MRPRASDAETPHTRLLRFTCFLISYIDRVNLSVAHGTIIAFPLSTWIIASFWVACGLLYLRPSWLRGWLVVCLRCHISRNPIQPSPTKSAATSSRIAVHPMRKAEFRGRVLLTRRPVWGLVLTIFCIAWMVWLFISWLPPVLSHGGCWRNRIADGELQRRLLSDGSAFDRECDHLERACDRREGDRLKVTILVSKTRT